MALKKQPSVVFISLPPGSTFFIDFEMTGPPGPVNAELLEISSDQPVKLKAMNGSISVPVGIGCVGRVRIPITDPPTGSVVYRVTNANGENIRNRKHDLSTLGLDGGDIYVCRCIGEPVL